jgi:hypothetical protein
VPDRGFSTKGTRRVWVRDGTQLRVGMLWRECTEAEVPVAKRYSTNDLDRDHRHDGVHQDHIHADIIILFIMFIIIIIAFV